MMFGEHATVQQFGLCGGGPDPGEFGNDFLNDLTLRASLSTGGGQLMAGGDDDLVIPASVVLLLHQLRAVEHPLGQAVDENRVRQRSDFAIEPEVDAGDGSRLELFDARQFCTAGELVWQKIEGALVRNSEDDVVGIQLCPIPEFDAGHSAIGDADLPDAGFKADLCTACGQPVTDCGAVQLFEGRGGNQDLPAVAGAEEAVDENLAGVREADAIQVFTECADEDHVPEAVDDGLRLSVRLEPVGHGWFVCEVDAGACQLFEPVCEFPFLAETEIREPGKGGKQVQGRGKQRAGGEAIDLKAGAGAAGTNKVQLLCPCKGVCDADGLTEAVEFVTAAHADVLAIVDQGLGLLVFKGAGATAEPGSRFEQSDRSAPLCQGDRGSQAGETASDDDCCFAAVFQ